MRAHARDGVDTTTTMKNKLPEVHFRTVMSLYEGAKMIAREDLKVLEEFEVKVGMHQVTVL